MSNPEKAADFDLLRDYRNSELLLLRFPEREHDYGAIKMLGPFSEEELSWANEVALPLGPSQERWLIAIIPGHTKRQTLAAMMRFYKERRKALGFPQN